MCTVCKGSGLVAPCVFGDEPRVAWPDHLERVEALHRPRGVWPRSSSATLAGLVKPVPCPSCAAPAAAIVAA